MNFKSIKKQVPPSGQKVFTIYKCRACGKRFETLGAHGNTEMDYMRTLSLDIGCFHLCNKDQTGIADILGLRVVNRKT